MRELSRLFEQHELIKVKFSALKEQKNTLGATMAEKTDSELVGIVGHTALLYRQHIDPQKREIRLPKQPVKPIQPEKVESSETPTPEA